MRTRIGILLAVLLVAGLTFATVVSANTATGKGTLKAHGDGLAALHGSGYVRLSGNGILWVKGAEHITIQGVGHKKEFPNGWTEYVGFHGSATISGKKVSIILTAENADLFAAGKGKAILWGVGTREENRVAATEWADELEIVSY